MGFSISESLEVIHDSDHLVVPDRHHPPILLTSFLTMPMEQPVSILDYKNANYEELNKIFSDVNGMDILSSNVLDKSFSKFN